MSAAGARRQRRMVPLEYIAFEHNNAAAELVKLAYDTPPLAFVHSYGCQQNVNDGERIKGVLMDFFQQAPLPVGRVFLVPLWSLPADFEDW